MTTKTLEEYAAAFEAWAEEVRPEDLRQMDAAALGRLSRLAEQQRKDAAASAAAIAAAVGEARAAGHSWAAIGARLGVTRQAAQKSYGSLAVNSPAAGP